MRSGAWSLMVVVALAACSSSGDDAEPSTSSPADDLAVAATGLTDEQCAEESRSAVEPLQEFIDQYDSMMVAEWNAIDPPPDVAPIQDQVSASGSALVQRGCDPIAVEAEINEAIADLDADGEVGTAIAAALRGEDPTVDGDASGAEEAPSRETEPSTVTITPGDDIDDIDDALDRVAEGSTLSFAAGVHEFDEPIVVEVGVRVVGAGRDETTIRSSAEGAALIFLGASADDAAGAGAGVSAGAGGGLDIADVTIEHVGEAPASVMLVASGPVDIRDVELSGGVTGEGDEGGGHGLVFAFDPLPGFPERGDDAQTTELSVTDTRVVRNQSAGVLLTGDAEPSISGGTVADNGECGLCYGARSGGSVVDTTVSGNRIGIQVSGDSAPTIDAASIVDNSEVGISVEEQGVLTVTSSEVARNGGVGIQVAGTSSPSFVGNTVDGQAVGVLATGEASIELADNVIANGEIGVQADGNVVIDAHDNQVWEFEFGGFSLAGQATADVRANTVLGSGEVGVSFVAESTGTIADNVVTGSGIGIQLGGSAAVDITGNTITETGLAGMLIADDASGLVAQNDVTGPGGLAILITGPAVPEVGDNQLNGGQVVRQPAGS